MIEQRAETLVVHSNAEHDGVLCNMSAGGFSLMLLRNVEVQAGEELRLVTEDGIHDCEVVHTQPPEESFQRIGVRRVADVPFLELPVLKKAKRWIRHQVGGFSPIIFFVFIGGFVGACLLIVTVLDVGSREEDPELSGQGGFVRHRETVSDIAGKMVDDAVDEMLDLIRGRHRRVLESVLNGTGKTWADTVDYIEITRTQEEKIMAGLDDAAAGDPDNVSPVQARSIIMQELTDRQRGRLTRLLDEAARLLTTEGQDD